MKVRKRAGGGDDSVPRRFLWLMPTAVLLYLAVFIIVQLTLPFTLGVKPQGTIRRTGLAQVISCDKSILTLGQSYNCESRITWHDSDPDDRVSYVSTQTVYSMHPLNGNTEIEQWCYINRGLHCNIIPASHPKYEINPFIQFFLPFMIGSLGSLVFGGWLASVLARRWPPKPKKRHGSATPVTSGATHSE